MVKKEKLTDEVKNLKKELVQRAIFGFSELMNGLLHVKVIRAFIDGVLRFGIPPTFGIYIVHPNKGCEK